MRFTSQAQGGRAGHNSAPLAVRRATTLRDMRMVRGLSAAPATLGDVTITQNFFAISFYGAFFIFWDSQIG